MAQKKQTSKKRDLILSAKCSQNQMYDSRLKKCVEAKGMKSLERYKIYDNMILGKGGYGGKKPIRSKKKK